MSITNDPNLGKSEEELRCYTVETGRVARITLNEEDTKALVEELFYAQHQHENHGQYGAARTAERLRAYIKDVKLARATAKIATCSHCGANLTYDEIRKEWLHDTPNAHTGNRVTCTKVGIAKPKRGTEEGV